MKTKQNTRPTTTRVIGKLYKTICILLLIFCYKITIHEYLYSYSYANLKQILYEWSKGLNVNGDTKFCFLQNPFFKVAPNRTSCISCESIAEIPEIYRTSFDEIELLSIHQSRPIVVTDVMFDWPQVGRMNEYNLNEIIAVWKDSSSQKFESCFYATNIRQLSNVVDYWRIISNPIIDNWFFAWRNCNLETTKKFRFLYQEPYFTKYFLPAPQVNWIITSSNYKSNSYKPLPVQRNRLLVLIQVKGALHYKLQVQEDCGNLCNHFEGILKESETLVFNSGLWDFQYLLHREGINISIMLEYNV